MALFKKLRESINDRFTEQQSPLIGTGTLGQGVVLSVRPGAAREFFGGVPERTCMFTLEVHIEGAEPYRVEATKVLPETDYRTVQPGKTTYKVWVDPQDSNNVEIDLTKDEEEEEAGAEEQ